MLRIAVCDDEKYYRDYIENQVLKCLESLKIDCEIYCYNSGKVLIELGIKISEYNIIFLDINMDTMDGITTAKKIREFSSNIYIVFVTAFISYALEGYKVDAVRYLLKNNDNFEVLLYECIDAILIKMNYRNIKISFPFIEGKKEVFIDKILYVESKLHKLEFWIVNKCELTRCSMYKKLDEVEKMIEQYGFIRIHQSILVNIKQIHIVNNYRQSVIVHELGHAFCLDDNPPESPSIMRYDRNREVLITPQQDDINGVNAAYK